MSSAPKPHSKTTLIQNHQLHTKDTGSAAVQIALLTDRIAKLSSHLQTNPKDIVTRRSLLKLVARRKKYQKQVSDQSTNQ